MKTCSGLIIILVILFTGFKSENTQIIGFWEGPHPENPNMKFYIHIYDKDSLLFADGYWTENNFYKQRFSVENLILKNDSIVFSIPNWECIYKGLFSKNIIHGGFYCDNEPFDSVDLIKNNTIQKYLISESDKIYEYHKPSDQNDGINVSNYKTAGDSIFIYSLLQEIIDNEYGRLNSFLLFKANDLICEEYFYDFDKDVLHFIESSTKSVTSLLIGIAKDNGFINDLNEPIYKIFPEYKHLSDSGYNQIALYHLLTMTSGFDPDEDNLFKSNNILEYALSRKLINPVGKKFNYDGGNTEILGAIIKLKTGMFADEFAEKYLFEPLGIENYNWDVKKQNNYPCMGGSLQLLPRDFAKIGLLVLNNGAYNGMQVISEEWIKESTRLKVKTHIFDDNYAYQWWKINLKSNNNDFPTIWANGWGSQFLYIIPDIQVLIVTTGYNYEYDSWAITEGIKKYLYYLDPKNF